MTTKDEALKLALEALEWAEFLVESDERSCQDAKHSVDKAITAIREALAHAPTEREQPAQQELASASVEPVARCMEHGECFGGECIYTSPPNVPTARARKPWVQATTWRGLTDDERNWLRKRNQKHDDYAKAVEALLKEKNQ